MNFNIPQEKSADLGTTILAKLNDALSSRNYMEFGSLISRHCLQGLIENDETSVDLYEKYIAEKTYNPNTLKQRVRLTMWEIGIPDTKCGRRTELLNFYRDNKLPLPKGFWKMNKSQLGELYYINIKNQRDIFEKN